MEDKCFYCNDTGYIHTEDDIPDQMCPHCEIGQAVIKGFNAAEDIGIQACDTLREAKDARIKDLKALMQRAYQYLPKGGSLQREFEHALKGD